MQEKIQCQKHDYHPITYLSTEHTEIPLYVYQRQCMKCGQKEQVLYKSTEVLSLKYTYYVEQIIEKYKKDCS